MLFGDAIVGRLYFRHLCNTEAGVTIVKRVELPAEYYGDDGKLNAKLGQDRFPEPLPGIPMGIASSGNRETIVFTPKIERVTFKWGSDGRVYPSDEVFATAIDFAYWGGWLYNAQPLMHVSGETCFTSLQHLTAASGFILRERVAK